ncbi:MAG: HigA family addiction module antitoxin [Treponema sp.]|nr:HigA family addiction module antitoxin [Treponema sp.]
MPKSSQTPSEALQSFIDAFQTNPNALSKSLNVAYQSVTFILKGKSNISPKMALRLAKHFGTTPEYWIDIQTAADFAELSADKKFQSTLKTISKAQKPTAKVKTEKKTTTKKAKKPIKKQATFKRKKRTFKMKTTKKSKN